MADKERVIFIARVGFNCVLYTGLLYDDRIAEAIKISNKLYFGGWKGMPLSATPIATRIEGAIRPFYWLYTLRGKEG